MYDKNTKYHQPQSVYISIQNTVSLQTDWVQNELHQTAQFSVLSYWIVVQSLALSVQSDGGYAIRSAVFTVFKSAGFTGNVHKSAKSEPEKSADRRLAQLPAEAMPPSTLENDWKSIQYVVPGHPAIAINKGSL